MNAWQLLALVSVCFSLSPASATDLLSSWQAARSYDATFSAAGNARAAGIEYADQADAAILPQVALTGAASRLRTDYQPAQNTAAATSALSLGQQYELALTLAQPIYDAGSRVRRAELTKQASLAEIQYRIAEQDLILRVAKAYFEVLLARRNLTLIKAQESAIALQLAMARKMFALGSATITDTNDAQARYDAVLATEIVVANDLEVKANGYASLTSLDPAQLAPLSEAFAAAAPQPATLDPWLALAEEGNPALIAQQIGLDIATVNIERYRIDTAPVLSLIASYGSQVDSKDISKSGLRDVTTSGSVGLQLSIPLYSGGGRSSQLRQAVALRDQQRDTREAVRRDTREATRQAFLGVSSGAAQIRALEQARISSASSVASSRRGREVGVRTTVDVLNAEQNYYQTLYNIAAAQHQYLMSRLLLAATIGTLDQTELAKVNQWLADREAQ
jgi:outer membrane protein